MDNQHLSMLADGINHIPDEQEISMTGKQYKDLAIGLLEFSDSLLNNQKWMYEFLYGMRMKEEPNPFWGEGVIEKIIKNDNKPLQTVSNLHDNANRPRG